jgi:hypothetical protein
MKLAMICSGFALVTACLAALAPVAAHAAEPAPKPLSCADDPVYHQQDFTLGQWDVTDATGKVAKVHIERALAGCALRETWTENAGRPGNGLGLFTYSRNLKSWFYLWAADNAAATSFSGALLKPGVMQYTTTRPLPDGRTRLRHWSLTLLPDGRVEELSVGSDDAGASWKSEYKLIWTRLES